VNKTALRGLNCVMVLWEIQVGPTVGGVCITEFPSGIERVTNCMIVQSLYLS
jgi:hypothetical protein